MRRRYVRHPDRSIVAVRLAADSDGLVYRKWRDEQRAKPGDWIVDSDGDIYTVDAQVFARTYRRVGPDTYVKVTPVWAERAQTGGSVSTKEGASHYEAGDYLVSNDRDGADEYAMSAQKFESLYTPADEPPGSDV
jgi:hypothetical protein